MSKASRKHYDKFVKENNWLPIRKREVAGLADSFHKMKMEELFPNGFSSWYETHHEIISGITAALKPKALKQPDGSLADRIMYTGGTGAIYELGKELTDKFEKLNKGREWDGEFFDEIEAFLEKELA